MDQFKSVAAAYNWLVNQIRHKGIFQEPINSRNRMDNWSVDEWVWGVFKFQLMDGGYYTRIRHTVDGWEAVERMSFGVMRIEVEGISEEEFLSIATLLKDAVDNVG